MQLSKLLLILLLNFSMISCSQSDPVLHDTQGHSIQMSTLKGKWVILNYWAGWCHTCVTEISELNQFNLKNKDPNVVFYGVNYDELSPDNLKKEIAKVNITYPVFLENPNTVWDLGEINVIPTTFIINPQGEVVKKISGGVTEKSLTETLRELQ